MKVLLIGVSGLLGHYLRKTAPESVELHSTFYKNPCSAALRLDTTDPCQVAGIMDTIKPEIVIHAAAVGSVDEAEAHPLHAFEANVRGALIVARAARARGARFVHMSSNAVFGAFPPPYSEVSAYSPVNAYGRQKAVADDALRDIPGVLIVRPILMYGWPESNGRGNWVTSCLAHWKDDAFVCAVTDVLTQPLYAGDCAKFIWKAVAEYREGVYHIAGRDTATIYQFTQAIAQVFQVEKPHLLKRAAIADFPSLAPRPSACWYVLDKLEETGYSPLSLHDGLRAMRQE